MYFKNVQIMARLKLFVKRTLATKNGAARADPIMQIYEYAFGFLGPYLSANIPPEILEINPPTATHKQ